MTNLRDDALLQRIKAVIEKVETVDSLSDVRNVKKLKTKGSYYRIRVGEYRIGITVNQETIIFVRVLNRKEIYRYFP